MAELCNHEGLSKERNEKAFLIKNANNAHFMFFFKSF